MLHFMEWKRTVCYFRRFFPNRFENAGIEVVRDTNTFHLVPGE